MKTTFLISNIFYWLPRGLAICFILFLGLFALDAFSDTSPFWQQLIGFVIHLTPNFLLLGLLLLAWKKEVIGGLTFIILAIIFTIWFDTYEMLPSFLLISLPVLGIGALFVMHGYFFQKTTNKS